MTTPPSILVLVPVYNEAAHILAVAESLRAAGYKDMLFINDGSTDETKRILEEHHIPALHHLINRGQGAAVQTGFDYAKKGTWSAVVTMDGDEQCDVKDIATLVSPVLMGEADMVVGNRFRNQNHVPLRRRFYNMIGSLITWLLSGTFLLDTQSGMRAYSMHALHSVEIEASGYEFCSDLIRQAGYARLRIAEVPIRVYYTAASLRKGQSFATGLHTVTKLFLRSIMR